MLDDSESATPLFRGRIVPPAPGRPHWVAPTSSPDLIYLGWGARNFSGSPIAEHHNPGWSYVLPYEGTVRITMGASELRLNEGQCLIAGPNHRFGLRHAAGERCKLLVWIFRSRPEHNEITPDENHFCVIKVRRRLLESVDRLHTQCREEVSYGGPLGEKSIKHLRSLLDIYLMRARDSEGTDTDAPHLLELARQWMHNNLAVADPVSALCEYLDVSQSTLRSMFRSQLKKTPRATHQEIRMAEAQRLISQEGWLVKQAAAQLGYRHANDLSRALLRFKNSRRPSSAP